MKVATLQQVNLLQEKNHWIWDPRWALITQLESYNLYLTPFIPFDLATNSEYNVFFLQRWII